jgi:hypothetical protein
MALNSHRLSRAQRSAAAQQSQQQHEIWTAQMPAAGAAPGRVGAACSLRSLLRAFTCAIEAGGAGFPASTSMLQLAVRRRFDCTQLRHCGQTCSADA